MKQKSLIKNALYNFLYTGLNLLFPLITAPYVSRVLGASNLGKVNFTTSVVNWFILFAVFGTSMYGVREVAKNRDNKDKLSNIFSEIVLINGSLSIIVTIIYFFLVFNINTFQQDILLYIIMSLSIILNMFSIDWFYQGIEEYRYITIRGALFKVLSLICIFLFVNSSGDYIIYGLISVLATSLSGILNYFYSKRFVDLSFRKINIFSHFKPLSIFFFHSLVVSLYTNLDQTMLGFMVNTKSVAFMNRSKVVTGAAAAISTSISNVTMPRASYYIHNDKKKFNDLLTKIPKFILWLTIPITIGIIVLSPNIMFILGGGEFMEAVRLLQVISLIIIFSPLSGYLQNQVLIPTGNERIGLYCAMLSSFLSIILNIVLIPKFGYIGAGITVVIAEFSAVFSRLLIIKEKLKYTELKIISKSSIYYMFAALIMGFVIFLINSFFKNMFIGAFLSIITGCLIYFFLLVIIKEDITVIMFKNLKDRLRI